MIKQRFQRALPMVKRYVELRNKHGLTPKEAAYFKIYIDDYIPVSWTPLSLTLVASMLKLTTHRLTKYLLYPISAANRCISTNVRATLLATKDMYLTKVPSKKKH